VIAVIIDPGRNPTSAKSVQPEIWDQALTPIPIVLFAYNALKYNGTFWILKQRPCGKSVKKLSCCFHSKIGAPVGVTANDGDIVTRVLDGKPESGSGKRTHKTSDFRASLRSLRQSSHGIAEISQNPK
jgi:hypothetical protein